MDEKNPGLVSLVTGTITQDAEIYAYYSVRSRGRPPSESPLGIRESYYI